MVLAPVELSLIDCYESYRQRYDMEQLDPILGKQKLLMTAYSTPDVEHEENWFKLTLIAYVNLWAARNNRVFFTSRLGAVFKD